MRKTLAAACAVGAMMLVGGQAASAATDTIVVDADGQASAASCNSHSLAYSTIQAAVDAAVPGTKILVCPGTYPEQVTISTAGIKLQSTQPKQAVIQAPASMVAPDALVRVTGGVSQVMIKQFTITGPFPDALFCSGEAWGVKVDGGASATIQQNDVSEIRSTDPGLRGCQEGLAIAVGRSFTGDVGHAVITGNTIETYQKGGIYVDGSGSQATIKNNVVTGNGLDPTIASNGIQISRDAIGLLSGNTITDNQYDGPDSATGILLYQANGRTKVSSITSSNDVGVYLSETTGAVVRDSSADNGFYGFYNESTSLSNKYTDNEASGNSQFDCEDDSTGAHTAGTANMWVGNTGTSSLPLGICSPPSRTFGSLNHQARTLHVSAAN